MPMTACGCVVVGFRNSRVECERAKEMVTLHVVCPSHTIPYSPLLQDQAWPVSIEPDRSGARKGRTRDRGRATEAEIPETWAGAGGLFCFRCGYWQICVERHRSFDQERAGADAECQVGGFAGLIANREGCETCYGPRPSCVQLSQTLPYPSILALCGVCVAVSGGPAVPPFPTTPSFFTLNGKTCAAPFPRPRIL